MKPICLLPKKTCRTRLWEKWRRYKHIYIDIWRLCSRFSLQYHIYTKYWKVFGFFFSCSQSVIVVKLRSHREGSCSLVITVTIITRRLQFLMLVFVVMSCGTDKNTTQPWGPLDLFSLGGQDTRREREFWYFLDICSFHQSKHAGSQGFLLLKWFDSNANCISCSMALMTFFLRLLTLKFHLFQKSF